MLDGDVDHSNENCCPPQIFRVTPPRWPSGWSALRLEDREFKSWLCRVDFSESGYTSDLKIGTPVATLSGASHYRVSAGTDWPGVSMLWLDEVEILICNFSPSVAACTVVWAAPSLRITQACYWDFKQLAKRKKTSMGHQRVCPSEVSFGHVSSLVASWNWQSWSRCWLVIEAVSQGGWSVWPILCLLYIWAFILLCPVLSLIRMTWSALSKQW